MIKLGRERESREVVTPVSVSREKLAEGHSGGARVVLRRFLLRPAEHSAVILTLLMTDSASSAAALPCSLSTLPMHASYRRAESDRSTSVERI